MDGSPTHQKPAGSQHPGFMGGSNSNPPSKRTRVVVSQSKQGCSTCKARRVKCDEQRPLCRRCLRAGRLCGGYAQTPKHELMSSSSTSASSSKATTVQPALKTGVHVDSSIERLSYLAAHVLSLSPHEHPQPGNNVWGPVFIQLSNEVECVKAATAAFGAAYEACLNERGPDLSAAAWQRYGAALARLRSALARRDVGLESIALASIILACTEILTQNEENALNHFLGAVQIVHRAMTHLDGRPPSCEIASIKDELVKVDVLIGSYGLAQTPQISQFKELKGYGDEEEEEEEEEGIAKKAYNEPHLATKSAMQCLYRSRQFIDSAAKVRYKYPSWRDSDATMCALQSSLADQCRAAREGLALLAERLQAATASGAATAKDHDDLADVYGVRTHVTATLIFILCAHDPFQTFYDEQLNLFQSIISDAAASSRLRRRSKPSPLKRFSTRPGVVSPLFLVVMKSRDPSMRAIATTMLREQCREGPSDGQIMASIGARVAALESAQSNTGPQCHELPLTARDILPANRIHGHGVFPERKTADGRRVVDVEFCRPEPPLEQGWGALDYTSSENWIAWREEVEILS